MSEEENSKLIREACLRLLARREHSGFELSVKLMQRGFSEAEIDPVIAELLHKGFQSDQRFAQEYARSRINKGYGPVKITQELVARGVTDVDLQLALGDSEFDEWTELAACTIRRKFDCSFLTDKKQRLKIMRSLTNRGFTATQINAAIDVITNDIDD